MRPEACRTASSRARAVSARRGMPFEWSFLLDALQTERDQGITLDTSQIRFRTPTRDVVLIDAPGHADFLRNMITGAAQADAALLIVDATEGVRDQTRRHGYLLHLLGDQAGRRGHQQDGPCRLRSAAIPRYRGRNLHASDQSRAHPDRRHPDFGPPWRWRRAAHRVRSPGTQGRPCSKRSTASRPPGRRTSWRCGFRCRRSTSSTIGASLRAGSRPAALRSATRSSPCRPARARGSRASKPGRFPTKRGRRARPAPDNRSASRSTGKSSSTAATSSPRRPPAPRRSIVCGRAFFGCTMSRSRWAPTSMCASAPPKRKAPSRRSRMRSIPDTFRRPRRPRSRKTMSARSTSRCSGCSRSTHMR